MSGEGGSSREMEVGGGGSGAAAAIEEKKAWRRPERTCLSLSVLCLRPSASTVFGTWL